MGYLDVRIRLSVSELMEEFDRFELADIQEWLNDNKPELNKGKYSPSEHILIDELDRIKESMMRLTFDQEEAIHQIAKSL